MELPGDRDEEKERDEGRASEIHLYYVIKGEREADWLVRDRVM